MMDEPGFRFEKGTEFVFGVVAEHDSKVAERVLDELTAWVMTWRAMPLLPSKIIDDCLVAPPERGSRHVELRWIVI